MEISQNHEDRIRRFLESGKYTSVDEVVGQALEALDEREEALAQELEAVRAKVREGTDQLKSGDYIECTDETLDAVLEDIEAEALSDLEPQRPHAD